MELRAFQKRFIRNALRSRIDCAVLSLPRGNGKSALAGYLVTRILSPDDELFRPGTESVLCAASLEQARIVFRFARADLEPTGEYRFIDSLSRIGITHQATNTKLRVIGSNGKTAMGLVGCPWVIADEPGAWEVNGGQLLHDAIETAKGKPNSPLQSLYIGTLAPSQSGWWHDLIADGSHGPIYVQSLQGDRAKWNDWKEIRRCNPLMPVDKAMGRKIREELKKAETDSRLKARFLSYRLNVPTADESSVLLTVDDWKRCQQRDVPPATGRPIVGVDLGAGRAWSAAVAVWRNGRTEAVAIAPGIPTLDEQETRDRVALGTYQRLYRSGLLRTDPDRRVPRVSALADAVRAWNPEVIVCDRFRLAELQDAVAGRCPVVGRVVRWSEAADDIRALRRGAADGPLAVAPSSRPLLEHSISVATVRTDDQGSCRMVKSVNNTARDDVAAAWILAAGALSRAPKLLSSGTGYAICA